MIFKVNTKTNKITAVGFNFEFKLDKNMQEFYKELENSVTHTNINVSQVVTHLKSHEHYILFGHTMLEGEEDSKEVFKEHFRFDLQDYRLKSPEGIAFNPRLLLLKKSSTLFLMDEEENRWILPFYKYWHSCIYPSNTHRENIWYLFEELTKSTNSLMVAKIRAAEKLYRSGFNLSSYDMGQLLKSLSAEELEDAAGSPWNIFGIPKYVYKDFTSNPQYLSRLSGSYGVKYFKTFKHLDLVWNNAKSFGVLDKLIDLLLSGNRLTELSDLLENKQYNAKRLVEYLYIDLPQKQGFENTSSAIEHLASYASMMEAVEGEISEKYPKHLKTEHDVAVSKFNKLKLALKNTEFLKAYEDGKASKWSYSGYAGEKIEANYFKIQVPTGAEDVAEEGKVMHHCVATYIDLVAKDPEKRAIVFLRRRNPSVSSWSCAAWLPALTIEIFEGKVVQVRGKFNRNPEDLEFEFLKNWILVADLEFSDSVKNCYEQVTGKKFKVTEAERKELCAV